MLYVSFSRESTVILSMYSAVDQQWPMDYALLHILLQEIFQWGGSGCLHG